MGLGRGMCTSCREIEGEFASASGKQTVESVQAGPDHEGKGTSPKGSRREIARKRRACKCRSKTLMMYER